MTSPMKILLAEDDSSIAMVAKLSLERIGGHSVTVAADGLSALDLASRSDFDLIILDSMMPGLDGNSVCRKLKALGNPTPIIFLSARSHESDIQEGLSAGAIGFIPKPFEPKDLCQQIQMLLDKEAGKTK